MGLSSARAGATLFILVTAPDPMFSHLGLLVDRSMDANVGLIPL